MKDSHTYFQLAADEALSATCTRARCGSVIITDDGEVIGRGHNAPPLEDERQRTCDRKWDLSIKPKYDKTCCVHAEWNAILDACKRAPEKMGRSTLYFMRIDDEAGFTNAGEPYCTVCSRIALQSGIAYFALWNDGEQRYPTAEYNIESYEYHKKTLAKTQRGVYN